MKVFDCIWYRVSPHLNFGWRWCSPPLTILWDVNCDPPLIHQPRAQGPQGGWRAVWPPLDTTPLPFISAGETGGIKGAGVECCREQWPQSCRSLLYPPQGVFGGGAPVQQVEAEWKHRWALLRRRTSRVCVSGGGGGSGRGHCHVIFFKNFSFCLSFARSCTLSCCVSV